MASEVHGGVTRPIVQPDGGLPQGHRPEFIPVSAAGGSPTVDTELPAAAALSDALANPTAPLVGACVVGFDGAVWRRGGMLSAGQLKVTVVGAGGTFMTDAGEGDGAGNHSGGYPAIAHPYEWSGSDNTWWRRRSVNISRSAQANALASGSDLTLWTPAAGKKFRLRGLVIAASVAGRCELRDSGTVLAYLRLAAGEPLSLMLEANGVLSAAANNPLQLRNQSGGAADLDAWVWGNEE